MHCLHSSVSGIFEKQMRGMEPVKSTDITVDACSADGAPLAKRRACATAGIGMNPASFDRECGRGQPTFRGVRRTARGRPAALVLRAAIDCAENVSHPGRQAP
jgi:hypothetical protein